MPLPCLRAAETPGRRAGRLTGETRWDYDFHPSSSPEYGGRATGSTPPEWGRAYEAAYDDESDDETHRQPTIGQRLVTPRRRATRAQG